MLVHLSRLSRLGAILGTLQYAIIQRRERPSMHRSRVSIEANTLPNFKNASLALRRCFILFCFRLCVSAHATCKHILNICGKPSRISQSFRK